MIDLVTGKTCDSLEDYPVGTLGGTGALLNGLYPLVCGVYVSERPNTNQCKILGFSGEYVSSAYKLLSIVVFNQEIGVTRKNI